MNNICINPSEPALANFLEILQFSVQNFQSGTISLREAVSILLCEIMRVNIRNSCAQFETGALSRFDTVLLLCTYMGSFQKLRNAKRWNINFS